MFSSVLGSLIRHSKNTLTSANFLTTRCFSFYTSRTVSSLPKFPIFPWFTDSSSRFVTVDASFCCAIRVSTRPFSANLASNQQISVATEPNSSCNCDGDKLYNAIIDSTTAGLSMESVLEEIDVELTTVLVLQVLGRLHYEEKIAFRFFMWSGRQEHYTHEHKVYNEMIDILSSTKIRIKQFKIVCSLLDYMKRNHKKSVPPDVLLTIMNNYAEKHLTHLRKIPRKKTFKVTVEPIINAFNLLVDALCKCDLVEYAEIMLRKVKKKLQPNAETYNILFFGWCKVKDPSMAVKLMEEMIEMGHKPDNMAYNTAIATLCQAHMLPEATRLFHFMKTQGSTMSSPTARTYAIMIRAFVKNDMIDEYCKLVNDMTSSGCVPDVSTYREVIEEMCLAGKVERAYQFIDEMGNKGYPPDIVTYNCFLRVLCEGGKIDDAVRLYNRMIERGCDPSVQSYNMMILMFFHGGDVDGAFGTWHEMEARGCARDCETYCAMIEGLLDCNRMEDVRWLLKDVARREIKLSYQKFDSFLKKLSDVGDLRSIHGLSEHMRRFYGHEMARNFRLCRKRKDLDARGRVW